WQPTWPIRRGIGPAAPAPPRTSATRWTARRRSGWPASSWTTWRGSRDGDNRPSEEDYRGGQRAAVRAWGAAPVVAVPRADLRADSARDQGPLPPVAARDGLGDPPAARLHGRLQPGLLADRQGGHGRAPVSDLLVHCAGAVDVP